MSGCGVATGTLYCAGVTRAGSLRDGTNFGVRNDCPYALVSTVSKTASALVVFTAALRRAARRIVRSFLRNENVMRMALLHRSRTHENELRLRAQLFYVPCSAITHARPQPADELIHERRQVPFV